MIIKRRKGIELRIVAASFLIFAFLSSGALAQPNYVSGYVIKKDNDTTFGEIDYQEWVQTPDSIFFKEKRGAEKLILKATDILGFYVAGEIYSSELVTIDLNSQKARIGSGHVSLFQKSIKKKVFILNLVKGEALSLYLYKKERENYYVKEDSSYIELISNEYVLQNNGKYLVVSTNKEKFVQQLKKLHNGCGDLISDENIYYSIDSLIDFTIECNDFLGAKKSYLYTIPKPKLDHGIVLGMGISNFKIPLDVGEIDYSSTSYFTFGYSADIILPRGRKKRKISAQLSFSSLKAKNSERYEATFFAGYCSEPPFNCQILHNQSFEESTVALSFLKLNIIYSSKFSAHDFSPTLLAGGSLGGLLYSRTNSQFETKVFREENGSRTLESVITGEEDVYDPVDFTLNMFGGLGFTYKKFSLSFLFEPRLLKNNIVPYQSFYTNLKIVLI